MRSVNLVHRLVGFAVLGAFVGSCGLPASGATGSAPPRHAVGYDVSSHPCPANLPAGGAFGIVGTTFGKPYTETSSPSCLQREYDWASALPYGPQYYLNLADPGHKSPHWHRGGPKACRPKPKFDVGCAYDYGYEAAAAAWAYTRAAGVPGAGRWWLDVEIDNSWGTSPAGIKANIADIRGALHYLSATRHLPVGIYTETTWWWYITNDTSDFSHVRVWGGGAGSKAHASRNCKLHSITGGPALMAQWIAGGVDHDIAC